MSPTEHPNTATARVAARVVVMVLLNICVTPGLLVKS
jgi:hypothetical protein